jgi:PIN domain nuclease of toxin-antitoxin system
MNLLLDTQIFLWFITNDPKLPANYALAIRDPANVVHLSIAATWEAVIKYALGKLPLPGPAHIFLPDERINHGIASLPVEEDDMPFLAALPHHHRDPFDRIMVAQAQRHQMTMLSVDHLVSLDPVVILPPV